MNQFNIDKLRQGDLIEWKKMVEVLYPDTLDKVQRLISLEDKKDNAKLTVDFLLRTMFRFEKFKKANDILAFIDQLIQQASTIFIDPGFYYTVKQKGILNRFAQSRLESNSCPDQLTDLDRVNFNPLAIKALQLGFEEDLEFPEISKQLAETSSRIAMLEQIAFFQFEWVIGLVKEMRRNNKGLKKN